MMIKIIFYLFATILVSAASSVITVRNPVHAALSLVLAFVSSAAIWLLLQAEFLAIALVLVYVGAVMILFLFVVMMLDINFAPLKEGFTRYLPLGLIVGMIILIEMSLVVKVLNQPLPRVPQQISTLEASQQAGSQASQPQKLPPESNTTQLGKALYTQYVYPFEIAAIILLVAMVAAIALTMRPRRWSKYQSPETQVNVSRKDRLRLIPMQTEPKDS